MTTESSLFLIMYGHYSFNYSFNYSLISFDYPFEYPFDYPFNYPFNHSLKAQLFQLFLNHYKLFPRISSIILPVISDSSVYISRSAEEIGKSMVTALRTQLESANRDYSNTCVGGVVPGWTTAQSEAFLSLSATKPERNKRKYRLDRRPIQFVLLATVGPTGSLRWKLSFSCSRSIWITHRKRRRLLKICPTYGTVPSLLGFWRRRCLIPGVVDFLDSYRQDLLFLGDLGVKRNKIGRPKLKIEEAVNEEWFLWTDIRDSKG